MKKFLLLLLLPLIGFGQLRDSIYVKTDIYEVMYSETLEQPLWVKYTVACTGAGASRKGMDFYTDKTIHTSDAKDYAFNVEIKSYAFSLRKHEIGRLAETISEAEAVTLRSYELGLYL